MTGQVTEIGVWDGWKVSAITDSLGAQVVMVRGEDKQLSVPFADHEAAEAAARRVLAEGMAACEWEGPPTDMFDLFTRLYGRDRSLAAG